MNGSTEGGMVHDTYPLGAYVLGALDAAERQEIDNHLAECAACRAELAELEAVKNVLDELPPEALLHEPPDADLVLQRTLRQVRQESNARAWQRRTVSVAAAAVLLAGALAGGLAIGRSSTSTPQGLGPQPSPSATTAGPSAPNVRLGTAFDPVTGTRLTVSVSPAAGWVRINASVNGIPAGENCRLVVVSSKGDEEVAAGWVVSKAGEHGGTNLDGSAAVAVDDIKEIKVRNTSGTTFVSLSL
jgi:anti-sigma factor RsiW